MTRIVKVSFRSLDPSRATGKSKGEVHDYFEHLGCRAAHEGMETSNDRARCLASPMDYGDGDPRKARAFKVEDIDTEPLLVRKRNKQEMADYDDGPRAGHLTKNRTNVRPSRGAEDGLRLRNKTHIQLGVRETQPMLHGEFGARYFFQLGSKRY
jgi:hypothetical protein